MFSGRVGDDCSINRLTIKSNALNALLSTVRMDSDLVLCVAELTANGVVASCLGQTGVDADAVVVGLDAEDELRDGVPHPSGSTREP